MAAKSIKLNTTALRSIALILAILCVVFAYIFAKWFFANTIAIRAVSLKDKNQEVAEFAVQFPLYTGRWDTAASLTGSHGALR